MALRKGIAYREIERPYTRHSKKRSKGYIKTLPDSKIVKFEMGNIKKDFRYKVLLISKEPVQIRDNSLEAVRIAVNRYMEDKAGRNNFVFRIRVHPHHILREHKMLTGAGADRMQSGMKGSFGKPTNRAAQVHKNQEILTIGVNKSALELAKESFKRIRAKLAGKSAIVIQDMRQEQQKAKPLPIAA